MGSEPLLSRAIIRVLQQAVLLVYPTAPADEVLVGTYNLWKFAFSLACLELSVQSCRCRGLERAPVLWLILWLCIVSIPGDPCYVCTPLGS